MTGMTNMKSNIISYITERISPTKCCPGVDDCIYDDKCFFNKKTEECNDHKVFSQIKELTEKNKAKDVVIVEDEDVWILDDKEHKEIYYASICPSCSKEVTLIDMFCSHCGQKLKESNYE